MSADDTASSELHRRFIEEANAFAPALGAAIERVGPPDRRDRSHEPIGLFLARAVIGQQLSTRAAGTIRARVESLAAERGLAVPDDLVPEHEEALRGCGVSRGKIRALMALQAAAAEGYLDGGTLAGLDHAERSRRLGSLHGVGQWTCDMVSIFHSGDPDVWPQTDVAVQRTFVELIGRRRKAAKAAARFAPHRSLLARYMWRITDADPD